MWKEKRNPRSKFEWNSLATFSAIIIGSFLFWGVLWRTGWKPALFVGLSIASFMAGCLIGFAFTSYGEETATVGKVRDWLVGGLTGLTVAKFGSLKALLLTFANGPGPQAFALTVGVSVTFATVGFFCMFFQRELILNVLLAESRDRRGRVEGTKLAGFVTFQLLSAMPPSILSGIDDIDELLEYRKSEADRLRKLLESEEVRKFLSQADEACRIGAPLDWDVASKAAVLHYYLTYFTEGEGKEDQARRALEWIKRALFLNHSHADLTAKYADILGVLGQYTEAVMVLERLDLTPEAPAYIKQWLGYLLLHVSGREGDAIRYSDEYHRRFPDESDSVFNSACGHAQKHGIAIKRGGQQPDEDTTAEITRERLLALEKLKQALAGEPEYVNVVAYGWVRPGESFESLKDDPEFLALVKSYQVKKKPNKE
jgi:tetratricopeptide (TPR) repeat protein